SPLERGMLYAGTDDGQLQLSRDAGRSWTEVSGRIAGLPDDAWVSGIEASRHAPGTVYVVFNNYRNDDYANYLYRSTDRGETWSSVTGDLPADRVLRTVRDDPRNPDVLWLGTELGLFVTNDGGRHWVELRANMPTMAFNDLTVHERDNDLVLATHNRGVWILDNVNAIQELTPAAVASDAQLFTIEPAALIRYSNDKAHTGDMVFAGENPPNGALIDYWLRTAQDSGAVTITVHDAQGARIASVRPARSAGINRVVWDLRHERLPAPPGDDDDDDGPAGVPVVPGVYTVGLAVAGRTFEQTVAVGDDPRLDGAPAERVAWTETLLRIADLYRDAIEVARTLHPLAQRLPGREGEAGAPLEAEAARDVAAIAGLMDELVSRIDGVYSAVQDWTGPPTIDQRSRIDYYAAQLAELRPRVETAIARHAR
ncbi:MAG: VPS10 domain-containing protein, partial [Longimicrobiales bacterium]